MNSTPEVIFIDKPFRVETLPLKNIYVLDNWLPSSLHHFYDTQISRANFWSKGNEVRGDSPTGLPHHQFWGGAIRKRRSKAQACKRIRRKRKEKKFIYSKS